MALTLSLLFTLLQCLKAIDQLPLLIAILLHLHHRGLLPLLMTIYMFIQGRKVLIDPLGGVGDFLLTIVE